MTAGELCNRTVAMARREEPVIEAARRMRTLHVGTLVVVDDLRRRRPVGILTDRDIVLGAVADGPDRLGAVTVGELMTSEVVTAFEGEDVVDLIRRMRSHGVRRVPVVAEGGRLVGIIAFDDLLEHLAQQLGFLAQLLAREQARERTSVSQGVAEPTVGPG
jgi:CBS domain-containing protein